MIIKTTLPISKARKDIFSIAEKVQKADIYYTLTERGRPKAVILSAKKFESLMEKKASNFIKSIIGKSNDLSSFEYVLADKARQGYENRKDVFSKAFILRDDSIKTYSPKGTRDLKYREDEYIKSLLYVELIEKYRYPLNLVELGRYVRTNGGERKRYIEVDIMVNDKNRDAEIIFEVTAFSDYEKSRDKIIQDLFDIAEVVNWGGKLKQLVYYSRTRENDILREKVMVIDYKKYKNFASWKKAGIPAGKEIPKY